MVTTVHWHVIAPEETSLNVDQGCLKSRTLLVAWKRCHIVGGIQVSGPQSLL